MAIEASRLAVGALALLPALLQAAEPGEREIASTAAERTAIAVTIYNDDLALVRERRQLELPTGLNRLALREVAALMKPETALLQAVSGPPLTVIEQNFDFDLLTPQKLLDKYVGRRVTVIRPHPTLDSEKRESATVLATGNGGTVLRFADRIETGVPGRLAFGEVPANLRERPTLSVLLGGAGGQQEIELTYLTAGLSWRADYVALLDRQGKTLDLSGWVTLNNRSGTEYRQARIQLVAGNVNRVAPRAAAETKAAAAVAPRALIWPREEAISDYHLYDFERPSTIADNQIKQLALLSAGRVPVVREYLLTGADYYYRERYGQIGQKLKPSVFIEFDNRGGELGRPLPAGIVRVYARDSQGTAQFVGEDRIEHTAKNERLRLRLGEAFDITADRTQTAFRRTGDRSAETSFRIELRNGKNEAVRVRVLEPLPGDWEISQETHKSKRESARAASWLIDIPAEGRSVLEYTAQVRW